MLRATPWGRGAVSRVATHIGLLAQEVSAQNPWWRDPGRHRGHPQRARRDRTRWSIVGGPGRGARLLARHMTSRCHGSFDDDEARHLVPAGLMVAKG